MVRASYKIDVSELEPQNLVDAVEKVGRVCKDRTGEYGYEAKVGSARIKYPIFRLELQLPMKASSPEKLPIEDFLENMETLMPFREIYIKGTEGVDPYRLCYRDGELTIEPEYKFVPLRKGSGKFVKDKTTYKITKKARELGMEISQGEEEINDEIIEMFCIKPLKMELTPSWIKKELEKISFPELEIYSDATITYLGMFFNPKPISSKLIIHLSTTPQDYENIKDSLEDYLNMISKIDVKKFWKKEWKIKEPGVGSKIKEKVSDFIFDYIIYPTIGEYFDDKYNKEIKTANEIGEVLSEKYRELPEYCLVTRRKNK